MIPNNIIQLITKKTYPEYLGGQAVCRISSGVTLNCDEYMFSISCGLFKSQLKNWEFCITVFELYLQEHKII